MSLAAHAKVAALMLACGIGPKPPAMGWAVLKHPFAYLTTISAGVKMPATGQVSSAARAVKAIPPVTKLFPTSSLLVATAQPVPDQKTYFNVMANETEVGQVLQAISARTGASIVYGGKPGTTVSINVRVDSAESAIRSVVAAAGLIYRKAGNTFIVAPAAGMRQAIEPYGAKATIKISESIVPKAIAGIQESLPYLTARVLGDRLTLIGLQEDIEEARQYIEHLSSTDSETAVVDDSVVVTRASAGEIVKVVSTMYPDVKVVTSSTQATGGAIALSGPAASVNRAKQLVARLDVGSAPSDSPDFETRVVELKFTSARALSEILAKAVPEVEAIAGPETPGPARPRFAPLSSTLGGSSLTSTGGNTSTAGGANGMQGQEEDEPGTGDKNSGIGRRRDRSRTVILRGSHAAVDRAVEMISRLDTKPKQVMVEVRVVETAKTFAENIGLNYSFAPFRFSEVPTGSTVGTFGSEQGTTRGSGLGSFSRLPFDVLSQLNAQVRDGKAKVLASPSVQVLDNEDANIFIGETIRARIAQATGFGAQTVDIREFPVGIVLLLKPRIGSDGNIMMHVNPVVSSITSLGADNIPQTSSREAETTVMVRDGETIAIGGLIRDEMSRVVSRVPLLSQIPILGELFKNRTTNKTRSDVIVTITPHIIRDDVPGVGKP